MPSVTVEVVIHYENHSFSLHEEGVRLNEDAVQESAAGLAYCLIEDVWGVVDDD